MAPRAHARSSLLSMGKESNCYPPPAARFNYSPCSAVSNSCIRLANDISGTLLLISKEKRVTPDFPPMWPNYQHHAVVGSSKYLVFFSFFFLVTNWFCNFATHLLWKFRKHLSQAPLKPGRNICLVRQRPPSMDRNRIGKAVTCSGWFWCIWKLMLFNDLPVALRNLPECTLGLIWKWWLVLSVHGPDGGVHLLGGKSNMCAIKRRRRCLQAPNRWIWLSQQSEPQCCRRESS